MRLDPSYLHFISKEQLRILVAIQIGMKNHEYVPLDLIASIGNLRSGQTFKTVRKLLKVKLVVHVGKKNNGYKLTYLGYDYLALHTFMKRGIIKDVICKIGVGKESDIYKCEAVDGSHVVLKLTRLGRRSFKTIKNNREYIQNRTSYNWLYLSRLSSMREFTFMQILHEDGFPTPRPIDTNRHAIVMSLIDGDPLCHVKKIGQNCSVKQIFLNTLTLVQKFASRGLIHGDFNQFNILISAEGKLTVIDFPQCVSSNHTNAKQYFDRDVQCLYTFFDKMLKKCARQQEDGKVCMNQKDVGFNVSQIPMPSLNEIQVVKRLDLQVRARGHFKLSQQKQLDDFMKQWNLMRQQQTDNEQKQKNQGYQSEDQFQPNQIQQIQQANQGMEFKQAQRKQFASETQQQQVAQKQKQYMQIDENDEDLKDLIVQLKQIQQMPAQQQKSQQKIQNKNSQDTSKEVQQKIQESGEISDQQQQYEEGQVQMRQQWKGLTNFQIRQIIKEQKKKQRQQKRKEMTTQQYIKKALYKKKNTRIPVSKGNYGAKIKNKAKSDSIKQGMQLGW